MSIRQVAATTTITWDNSQITVPAGTVLDVPPGGPLETALGGAGNVPVLAGNALYNAQTGGGPAATDNA